MSTPARWRTFQAAAGLLIGLFLILGAIRAPVSLSKLEGTCPGPSADPMSVCYDPNSAQAMLDRARIRQALQVATAAVGYHCWTTPDPKRIPTHAVMRSPGGSIRMESFDQAWQDAHRGFWTLALCS